MVDVATARTGKIDLSFMASLECDLACGHCMYNSSRATKERLDFEAVAQWCCTVDWAQVHAVGLYGGEPAVDLAWYQRFVNLVPAAVPLFVITNGTWSTDAQRTSQFVDWAEREQMQVVVSGTRWHLPRQDRAVLERLAAAHGYALKGEERQLIAMGRAKAWLPSTCTVVCARWDKPWRVALHPTQDVIFQSCDGEYPRLQGLDEPFCNILPNIARLVAERAGRLLPQGVGKG